MPTSPNQRIATATSGSSLADVLERVLDKGIVIAGDISVSVGSTELLSIRIRLLVSSVDKAKEMGINWWENDPYLSSKASQLLEANQQLLEANQQMQARISHLETEILASPNASGLAHLSMPSFSDRLSLNRLAALFRFEVYCPRSGLQSAKPIASLSR
ncbi:gas vesicle protein [Leptolyngbya sp. 7M]|nr:gas vesicle protein [Leptolyngbya sp. 7M]